jgi:hypothetical protein
VSCSQPLLVTRPHATCCCRLIFAGKQMSDDKQAKEYNIEGGSVLHLVRGGDVLRLRIWIGEGHMFG